MNRKKFLYFANSTADAVCIDASKVTDVEILAASGAAKLSVNYQTNVLGDGSILMDTDDSVAAARHIQRLIATGHGPVITIADDVNSSYIEGVTACGTITHSA